MLVGRVVGEVWATRKDPSLEGLRLLLVRPLDVEAADDPSRPRGLVVVADTIGAGVGEEVVVAYGRAGRVAIGRGHDLAAEAAVVGIVDDRSGEELR
ncbi:MAG: EutN/CcmL family microcompartment protein [Planctomycetota bacterium JB042]